MATPSKQQDIGEAIPLVESRLNKGMITIVDAADIETAALTVAKNFNVRYDKTSRRSGFSLLSPAKPNSKKILALSDFKDALGVTGLFRITRDTVHSTDLAVWTNYPWAGAAGTDEDRISYAVAYDPVVGNYRLFFVNNGANKVQAVDHVGISVGDVDAAAGVKVAPKAKFLTYFFNRLVAAHDPNVAAGPISVYWSGDGKFQEWDAATEVTAGQSPLQESPGDKSDFITGVFGFTNVLVVPRERSIWLGNKQPSGQDPFYLYGAIPGLGCNCPYSIDVVPSGLCFVDTTTGSVWAYAYSYSYGYVSGSGAPERIGLPVENEIVNSVTDPDKVFGSYNNYHNEYVVAIPIVGSGVVKLWKFNFKTKAWSYDERPLTVSCIEDIGKVVQSTPISDLAGNIEDLQGAIEDLGTSVIRTNIRLIGHTNGEIEQDDPSTDVDSDGSYDAEVQTKDFWLPDSDMSFAEFSMEYVAHIADTISIYYSKDSGRTWRFGKTILPKIVEVPKLFTFRKNIKARRLRFKIYASSGVFDILSYKVSVYPGGESRENSV